MADLAVWQRTIVDEEGNVIPGAEIEVRREEDDSLATLYADRAGETPLANPLAADMSGFVRFFAQGDAYTITAVGAGSTRTWRFDPTGRLQEFDRIVAEVVTGDSGEQAAIRDKLEVAGRAANLSDLLDVSEARSNLGALTSLMQARSRALPLLLSNLHTLGFYEPGDGGGAKYRRALVEPAHSGKFQTSDGAWWELDESTVTPQMFGAIADGASHIFSSLIGGGASYASLAEVQAVYPQVSSASDDVNWIAVKAAEEYLSSRGGGRVLIRGDLRITDVWQIEADNITVEGASWADKVAHEAAVHEDVIRIDGCKGVHVRNLHVDGRRDLKSGSTAGLNRGIKIIGSEDCSVTGCYVHDTYEHGISVGASATDDRETRRINVSGNLIVNCGNPATSRGMGVWLFWKVYHATITNNILLHNEGGGIMVDDVSSSAETGGSCEWVTIVGNLIYSEIEDLADSIGTNNGIVVSGCRHFVISGNYTRGYRSGISLHDSQANEETGYGAITGNTAISFRTPIGIQDAGKVVVTGNFFQRLIPQPGVSYVDSPCVLIESRREAPANSTTDVLFASNLIYAPFGGVSVLADSSAPALGKVSIKGNRIVHAGGVPTSSDRGIYLSRTADVVVADNDVSEFYDGIVSSNGGRTTIKGNIISDSVNYGLNLSGSDGALAVLENMTMGSSTAGIRVNSSADTEVTVVRNNTFLDDVPLSGPTAMLHLSNNYPIS